MKLFPSCAILISALMVAVVHADTALEGSMKKMEEATKQLGPDLKQTDPAKHNKNLDLQSVATIKAECLKARDQEPKKAKALPADQAQTMTTSYQKDMDTFVQHVDQLNADIQAEKWDVAQTDFTNLMKEQHDDHKLYRVKK